MDAIEALWLFTTYASLAGFSSFFLLVLFKVYEGYRERVWQEKRKWYYQNFISYVSGRKHEKIQPLNEVNFRILARLIVDLLKVYKPSEDLSYKKYLEGTKFLKWVNLYLRSRSRRKVFFALEFFEIFPDEMEDYLLDNFSKYDPFVKYQIMKSLSKRGHPKYFFYINDEFVNEGGYPILAMSAIYLHYAENAHHDLIDLATVHVINPKVRSAVLIALLEMGGERSVYDLALDLTEDSDEELRRLAYEILANSGLSVSRDAVLRGLGDPDFRIRMSAIRCLGNSDVHDFETLNELMADPNWLVSLEAGKLLYHSGALGRQVLYKNVSTDSPVLSRRSEMLLNELDEAR